MSGKLLSNVRIAILVAGMVSALVSTSAVLAGKADDTLNVAFPRETDFIDQLHTNSTESTRMVCFTTVRARKIFVLA